MKYLLSIIMLLSSFSIQASEDEWSGEDKRLHFIAGVGVGFIGNAFDSPKTGCVAGFIVGALKEGYDSLEPKEHTVSIKDIIVTTLGACLTSNVSGFLLGPGWIKYKIVF